MRVLLVNMPWAPIDVPSLALGILREAVAGDADVEVEVVHANLDYVDWITERYDFNLHDYYYYSVGTYFVGVGDWTFSSALYDNPQWRVAEFEAGPGARMTEAELRLNRDIHALAPGFVGWLARRLVDRKPDVVGFTSTFQQNVAALATAREVKRIAPQVVTVFGGANSDGAQGAALHRCFPFADYAVRGEGEVAFPALLQALRGRGRAADIPGLCWRDADGRSHANPMSSTPLPPGQIVRPDYDGYFERLAESAAATWVEPKLVVEGARGCWWGEKHHCTFCGLNGSFMQFRSKSPAAFGQEIVDLANRHQVLDMYVVDNILDMGYLTSLLPSLIEAGYDLRLVYEIKANMRLPQLQTLADAGVVNVQPGIENLSTRVLKLMEKGVSGCQNVRLLRDAETCGLSVAWNYLYGFPGETPADYLPLIEQLPALHHLQPCAVAVRLAVERFSPFFNRPELGFTPLTPNRQYAITYDLPTDDLIDLAYLFDGPERGIGEDIGDRLRAAIEEWTAAYPASSMSSCDTGSEIVVVGERRGFDWSVLRLNQPLELAAFRLLEQPHSAAGLARSLADAGLPDATPAAVRALLERWRQLGLVFTDNGQWVHVVPVATNQELHYVDPAGLRTAGADAVADPGMPAAEPLPAPVPA